MQLVAGNQGTADVFFANDAQGRELHRALVKIVHSGMESDVEKFIDIEGRYPRISKEKVPDPSTYEELRQAYLRASTVIRFVPYGEMKNEPPCAGPDYQTLK